MRLMDITKARAGRLVVPLIGAVIFSSCNDVFSVENPGRVIDEDLNDPRFVQTLVSGMSADFSEGFDGQAFAGARLGDEMAGSGSYFLTGQLRRGLVKDEDIDGFWEDAHRARWTAEGGLQRMQNEIEGYEFEGNPLTARAYLMAGLSNRWLGENFCEAVYSGPYEEDTGEVLPRTAAFERGLSEFQESLEHAELAGDDELLHAARGGIAQMHLNLGQYEQAAAAAAQVPTDFLYVAHYSDNEDREYNEIWSETHNRAEISAYAALAGSFTPADARAPYVDCRHESCESGATGADGSTPHLQQMKYPDRGADIPLVKGTEMRLIEAEAALQAGDLATFNDKVNEARAHYDLDPIEATSIGSGVSGDAESMTAWDVLDRERHLTLWLEARRLRDLDRWDHPFLDGGKIVYEPEVARRPSCFPVSESECQTNPNIPCP